MSHKPAHRLTRALAADPFFWAVPQLLHRLCMKAKSKYCGMVLHSPGLYLGPGSHLSGARHIRFGMNFYAHGHLWMEAICIYQNQRFSPIIEIGENVSFSERVHVSCIERISLGNRVLVGSGTFIGDHHHGSYSGLQQSRPDTAPASRLLGGGGPIFIDDNVWIGDNVVIIGPVSIGRGAIIGANSVVRRDIPPMTIAAGVPARPIKRFDESTGRWERIVARDLEVSLDGPHNPMADLRP